MTMTEERGSVFSILPALCSGGVISGTGTPLKTTRALPRPIAHRGIRRTGAKQRSAPD